MRLILLGLLLLIVCVASIPNQSTLPTMAKETHTSIVEPTKPTPTSTSNPSSATKLSCVKKCFQVANDGWTHGCQKGYGYLSYHSRCSIAIFKSQCRHVCSSSNGFCKNVCKKQKCGDSTIKNCQKTCFRGQECKTKCLLNKLEKCISMRFHPRQLQQCSYVIKKKTFQNCLYECSNGIPPLSCAQKCSLDKIPNKFQSCKQLVHKNHSHSTSCSISFHRRQCHLNCKNSKPKCSRVCKERKCGTETFTSCAWKCSLAPRLCVADCTWKLQMKCYQNRLPNHPEHVKCKNVFQHKPMKSCLRNCVITHPFIPRIDPPKPPQGPSKAGSYRW